MADLVLKEEVYEEAQLLNYLKASGAPVGLLINFGSVDKLEWKRFVYGSTKKQE